MLRQEIFELIDQAFASLAKEDEKGLVNWHKIEAALIAKLRELSGLEKELPMLVLRHSHDKGSIFVLLEYPDGTRTAPYRMQVESATWLLLEFFLSEQNFGQSFSSAVLSKALRGKVNPNSLRPAALYLAERFPVFKRSGHGQRGYRLEIEGFKQEED